MPLQMVAPHGMTDTRTIRLHNRQREAEVDVAKRYVSALDNIGERLDVWGAFSEEERAKRRTEYSQLIVDAVLALTRRLS